MSDQDAKSVAKLAGELGIARRTLQDWRHINGCPQSLDAEEWRKWMDQTGVSPNIAAAIKLEKLHGLELDNEKRELEVKKLNGELYSLEQMREALEGLASKWISALEKHLPTMAESLTEPHAQPAARKKAKDTISIIRSEVADALKAIK